MSIAASRACRPAVCAKSDGLGRYIDTVKWLHANRTEGCTTDAMDWAALRQVAARATPTMLCWAPLGAAVLPAIALGHEPILENLLMPAPERGDGDCPIWLGRMAGNAFNG
ncbi:hypothetical protein PF005_g17278 [Phytophthora fragariae]|nr:hypothetical protein PF003_g23058 [Phytophthora fragariae]KAE8931425.1 hypothetical protein PF009_g18511 [Phytophthora fragariae]KAE8996833.1 hypothetical protein PF011_g15748 [Phytophthora fragariae]KAE9094996.1 hypothetical protein PF010_g16877 [Phytophthora fragariae]KAE9095277.1 hypothetical protein PF007_g17433 [Phytophthora fragariae]